MILPRIDPTPEEQQTARELTEALTKIVDWESVSAAETFSEAAYTHVEAALASARARDQQRIVELTELLTDLRALWRKGHRGQDYNAVYNEWKSSEGRQMDDRLERALKGSR